MDSIEDSKIAINKMNFARQYGEKIKIYPIISYLKKHRKLVLATYISDNISWILTNDLEECGKDPELYIILALMKIKTTNSLLSYIKSKSLIFQSKLKYKLSSRKNWKGLAEIIRELGYGQMLDKDIFRFIKNCILIDQDLVLKIVLERENIKDLKYLNKQQLYMLMSNFKNNRYISVETEEWIKNIKLSM